MANRSPADRHATSAIKRREVLATQLGVGDRVELGVVSERVELKIRLPLMRPALPPEVAGLGLDAVEKRRRQVRRPLDAGFFQVVPDNRARRPELGSNIAPRHLLRQRSQRVVIDDDVGQARGRQRVVARPRLRVEQRDDRKLLRSRLSSGRRSKPSTRTMARFSARPMMPAMPMVQTMPSRSSKRDSPIAAASGSGSGLSCGSSSAAVPCCAHGREPLPGLPQVKGHFR